MAAPAALKGRSYGITAAKRILDPGLAAMPDANDEDIAVGLGNVDDDVSAAGMDAHRRVDLGALVPDPRLLRQQLEGFFEPAMVGVRPSGPEVPRSMDVVR
jgi:hypothetical protein